jgi:FkbM family methyltransferase
MRNIGAVARSPDISPGALASTYARLRLARAVPGSPRRAQMLGWEVAYVDYPAVVGLFEEIFVRRHYPFRPARSAPFVVDCGANIGVSTMFFKTLAPEAEILAFEPEPTAFRLLTQNVESNGMALVECRSCAVAREDGRHALWSAAPAHGGASLEFRGPGWTEREVETVRLSDCIGDRRVDFLKLDIEGSEIGVLAELDEAGVLRQVDEIGLEHHPRNPDDLPRLLRILVDAGFTHRLAVASDAFWDPGQLLLVHAFRESRRGATVAAGD